MAIPPSIKKRLEKLEIYLAHLEEIGKTKKEEFLDDWKSQDIVIRNFQIAIESCIDIGSFIISRKGLAVPDTYVEVMEVLGKINVLPKNLTEEFKELVRFRNIIVHDYLYLDYEKIYKNLGKIDRLKQFANHILKYFG